MLAPPGTFRRTAMHTNSNNATSSRAVSSDLATDTDLEPSFDDRLHEAFGSRAEYFLDLLRIYLGLGLCAKGIQFIVNSDFAGEVLMRNGQMDLISGVMSHYIPIAHIA